jgi:signal transduction histidine kinase
MSTPLVEALRESLARLTAASPGDPREAIAQRRITREIGEALSRLEGRETRADLVAIICHDFKDPLASIVMGTGFLRKTIAADEGPARRVVEAIVRSTERMTRIIADFHDLARIESGRLTLERHTWNVGAIVQTVVQELGPRAVERSVTLEVDAAPEPQPICCDKTRVAQALSNVVSNAIRFTPPGGRVLIRELREPPGSSVRRIQVADTGKGIAAERLSTIFDYTDNARRSPRDGPGLGLAIARGLVDLHGGTLDVESPAVPGASTPGEGSTFTFTLPRGFA